MFSGLRELRSSEAIRGIKKIKKDASVKSQKVFLPAGKALRPWTRKNRAFLATGTRIVYNKATYHIV